MAAPDPAPQEAPPGAIFDRLAQRRLIVVSGKGGVGRTTLAALLGLAIAARGRRVLVTTTGHDDRLGWMLGAPSLPDRVHAVSERLHIQRLVPRVCLREYGAMVVRSERVSAAVFDNKIIRRLLQAIPGLDDFAVFGKAWHEAARGDAYDPAELHPVFIDRDAIVEQIIRDPADPSYALRSLAEWRVDFERRLAEARARPRRGPREHDAPPPEMRETLIPVGQITDRGQRLFQAKRRAESRKAEALGVNMEEMKEQGSAD